MASRDDELESFKTAINLSAYAAGQGYALDRRATSRNSAVMRHPKGDKVVIARDSDQHWTYFSVKDHQDHGSIIDFVQKRQGCNLGQVRVELRPWLSGDAVSRTPIDDYAPDLEPIARDLGFVRAAWEAMEQLPFGENAYLNQTRRISATLLSLTFLQDRIRVDARGNVCFPHFTLDGLSGFEIKNRGFTGFAPHGTKGLWGTRPKTDDERLVIAETAIDALSYAALHGHSLARLVSIGGSMNPQQPDLIERSIKKLPHGKVVMATDNDDGGDAIARAIEEAFHRSDRGDLELLDHRPPTRGEDWNQVLQRGVDAPTPGPAF